MFVFLMYSNFTVLVSLSDLAKNYTDKYISALILTQYMPATNQMISMLNPSIQPQELDRNVLLCAAHMSRTLPSSRDVRQHQARGCTWNQITIREKWNRTMPNPSPCEPGASVSSAPDSGPRPQASWQRGRAGSQRRDPIHQKQRPCTPPAQNQLVHQR